MTGDAELTSYDSIADIFIAHARHPDSWNNLYDRPYMLGKLPNLQDKNVLDIGCSTGFYTEYALEKGASVTAIDVSQKLIDKLAERLKSSKLTLQCADISKPMPFLKSESFDLVIASLVLDYIKDWSSLLNDLYRVVKKRGKLIFTFVHPLGNYLHKKPESYYDFKLVEDTWGTHSGNPFKTHYYIRPLTEMLNPILHSKFAVGSFQEMLPDEGLKKTHPEIYQRLVERPGFIYVEMDKPAD